jgi:hypothetical protein
MIAFPRCCDRFAMVEFVQEMFAATCGLTRNLGVITKPKPYGRYDNYMLLPH